MLDLGHLPSLAKADVQIFQNPISPIASRVIWQTWECPRGASMLHIICLQGGGGGGGGFTGIAGSARGGGGGGGSGACTRVTLPTYLLPEILYVAPGIAGLGGGAGAVGGDGAFSFVLIAPNDNQTNGVACSSNNSAFGGGAGTAVAAGAGGTGGTVAPLANHVLVGLGIVSTIAGQNGAAGGAQTGAGGGATTIPTTSAIAQGGAGGAGTTSGDFFGGACTAIANAWLSEQRPATPPAGTTGQGSGGPQLWEPLFSFGGLGGSSSNAAAGGVGGPGGYGAGGGGGGAGTTGGRGGDGGPGLIIMIAW